jgi:hypothetical protein
MMALLSQQQRTSALLTTVLPPGIHHLSLLRTESCSLADSASRPLNTASPTSPLPELRHGKNTYISAAYWRATPTVSSPHGEQLHAFPSDRISLDSVRWPSTQLCKFLRLCSPGCHHIHLPAPTPDALQPKDVGTPETLNFCQALAAILVDEGLVLTSYLTCGQHS